MKLSNYPLVRILIPFVLGILCAYLCRFKLLNCRICSLAAAAFWLLSVPFLHLSRPKLQWVQTLLISVAFVFAGASATLFRTTLREDDFFTENLENQDAWIVRVVDFPQVKAKSVKVEVEVFQGSAGVLHQRQRALLYLGMDSVARQLRYGDLLMVSTRFQKIKNSENPDSFDYERYMARRGLHYSGYVAKWGWQRVGRKVPDPLKALAKDLQQYLSKIFADAGMDGQEYDIIRAILLGDDDTMDPSLKSAYAAAGVSHILCVSGMHVGVIFMIINFLLKPMDSFPKMRVLKSAILLGSIWLYAAITGLSPSVTRSATMFTFVTLGALLNRHTNIFHSLLASLFIILTINPLLLFEVGFQLSYLAVFGIVLFQPKIADLWHPKNRIVQYFWELMAVSVAAQLFTFPICTYYFGQFANYFLLSNLSVVSLSFVVMVTGVCLLVLSFIPWLGNLVTVALTWEIRIMNRIILFIEGLPGSVTVNIDYSVPQVLLLYVSVLCLYLTIHYRRHLTGWIAYVSFVLFSMCFVVKKMQVVQQQEVVIYAVSKSSAISFCDGTSAVLFSDSIRGEKDQRYQYSIANHVRRRHLAYDIVPMDTSRYSNRYLYKQNAFIRFGNKTYYILKGDDKLYPMSRPDTVDVLVLSHNPHCRPEVVRRALFPKEVVTDGTCSPYCIERWKSEVKR